MKATAKYVLNVEIRGDGPEDTLVDCHIFANHLHQMLDMYRQIGSVYIEKYWIGDGDGTEEEASE